MQKCNPNFVLSRSGSFFKAPNTILSVKGSGISKNSIETKSNLGPGAERAPDTDEKSKKLDSDENYEVSMVSLESKDIDLQNLAFRKLDLTNRSLEARSSDRPSNAFEIDGIYKTDKDYDLFSGDSPLKKPLSSKDIDANNNGDSLIGQKVDILNSSKSVPSPENLKLLWRRKILLETCEAEPFQPESVFDTASLENFETETVQFSVIYDDEYTEDSEAGGAYFYSHPHYEYSSSFTRQEVADNISTLSIDENSISALRDLRKSDRIRSRNSPEYGDMNDISGSDTSFAKRFQLLKSPSEVFDELKERILRRTKSTHSPEMIENATLEVNSANKKSFKILKRLGSKSPSPSIKVKIPERVISSTDREIPHMSPPKKPLYSVEYSDKLSFRNIFGSDSDLSDDS